MAGRLRRGTKAGDSPVVPSPRGARSNTVTEMAATQAPESQRRASQGRRGTIISPRSPPPPLVETVEPENNLVYTETQRLRFCLQTIGQLKMQLSRETNRDPTAQRSVPLLSPTALSSPTHPHQRMLQFVTATPEPFCPQESKGRSNPFVAATGRPSEGEQQRFSEAL